MKTDDQIQQEVIEQLKWEPILNAAEIGVSVKQGVVTLTGIVDAYVKKLAAEQAVKNIAGVKAIAEDIQVGVSALYQRTDAEIAASVLQAIQTHTLVNQNRIRIKVEDGIVSLEGDVDWDYQRKAVSAAINHLPGIRMLNNFLLVKPTTSPVDIKQKIAAAFQRHANLEAELITVDIVDGKAILRGHVRSMAEKEDAAVAAWSAPGISMVDNQLEVSEDELVF